MFNKLLNRITSPEQGRPPGRSLNYAEAEDKSETAEGFICPHCLLAFATGEALQSHYESAHQETGTGNDKDESNPELELLKSQIRALEEGKSLTSSEILLLRKQLTESMEVNIALRQERENLQKKATTEMEEMTAMKHLIEQQQKECNNLRNQLKDLEERKSVVEHQLQQRPAADDVVVLRQELVSVQKMMDKLTLEKQAEKDAIQDEYSLLQAKYSSLEEQKQILEEALRKVPQKDEIERLKQKILEDTTTIAHLQETICQKENENKIIRQGFQTNHESLKQKEAHILTLSQELTKAQKESQNLSKERGELKSQLRVKDSEIEDCQRMLSERVKEISEMQEKLSNAKERTSKLESERTELYVKIESGEGTNTALQQLKQENEALHKKMKDQQQVADNNLRAATTKSESIFQQYQETKSLLSSTLEKCQNSDAAVAELNSQLSDCKQRLNDLQLSSNNKVSELQNEMEQKEQQCETKLQLLRSENQELVNACSIKATKLKDLNVEISDTKAKCKQLQENTDLYKEELKSLQTTYEEVANKLNRSESERQDFISNISSLKEELKRMYQEFEQCQINEQQAITDLENFKEIKKELDEKIKSLDSEVSVTRKKEADIFAEKEKLSYELNAALQQLTEVSCRNTELNHNISTLQQTYQQDQEETNKEISELNDAKQLLINQKLMLQGEIDNIREEIEQAKVLHQHELQHLQEYSENLQLKIEDFNKKLEEEIASKRDLQNHWQMQESKYDAEISILNENLSTLREDLLSEHNRCENLEKKSDELKGDNLELQAKLENTLDERRALLERCLKSEEECEKLRNTSVDLRHKLEDTIAALQELGRENQTLQMENTKHQSRKWAEDAEVTHCTMCGKQFSVTIRKHHCRNCGNIFCNDCSSKSAPTALSKKPVRVCDNCFSEVAK